jgi:hypothetical protein
MYLTVIYILLSNILEVTLTIHLLPEDVPSICISKLCGPGYSSVDGIAHVADGNEDTD